MARTPGAKNKCKIPTDAELINLSKENHKIALELISSILSDRLEVVQGNSPKDKPKFSDKQLEMAIKSSIASGDMYISKDLKPKKPPNSDKFSPDKVPSLASGTTLTPYGEDSIQ